jgi:hypothetical protein
MWMQHLSSFIGSVAHVFFEAIGTTILGWIVNGAFAASLALTALNKINRQQGWRAMLNHWRKEYKRALKFSLWCAVIIYSPIFVYSVGKAVYEDHEGLVHRSHDLREVVNGDALTLQHTKDECSGQVSDQKIQNAGLVGANGQLQSQNRDQQNTINNCQTQALKLLAPEPTSITALYMSTESTYTEGVLTAKFVLLTNHAITPVKMGVTCDRPIITGYSVILGSGTMLGGSGPTAQKTLDISIESPSWTKISPVLVVMKLPDNKTPICTFTER